MSSFTSTWSEKNVKDGNRKFISENLEDMQYIEVLVLSIAKASASLALRMLYTSSDKVASAFVVIVRRLDKLACKTIHHMKILSMLTCFDDAFITFSHQYCGYYGNGFKETFGRHAKCDNFYLHDVY